MPDKPMTPGPDLMLRIRGAFLAHGYSELSMIGLAKACGFTRRALYNYFSSKEEAFRALLRYDNAEFIRAGLEAGDVAQANGADPAEVFAAILATRYGVQRRAIDASPHKVELNTMSFGRCGDLMIETAIAFQKALQQRLVAYHQDGFLRLTGAFMPAEIAQLLADGARGVTQGLPPAPPEELAGRYQRMCRAILFGAATPAASLPDENGPGRKVRGKSS